MGIIRGKLWNFITQGDEDKALAALRKYRREKTDSNMKFCYRVRPLDGVTNGDERTAIT